MKTCLKILLITLSVASAGCHKNYMNRPPGISTLEVTGVTATTAVCGGELDYFEPSINLLGISWWAEQDTVTEHMDVDIKKDDLRFSREITGLVPNTKYYVSAYVGTEWPGRVDRGETIEFTTLPE